MSSSASSILVCDSCHFMAEEDQFLKYGDEYDCPCCGQLRCREAEEADIERSPHQPIIDRKGYTLRDVYRNR